MLKILGEPPSEDLVPRPRPGLPADAELGTELVSVDRGEGRVEADRVAREEPLEIRLDGEPLAVTMRTPGHDEELVAGFLFTEGIVGSRADFAAIVTCAPAGAEDDQRIRVALKPGADGKRVESSRRSFRAVSACGLCGKSTLEDIYQQLPDIEPISCEAELLRSLPGRMRAVQPGFDATGGMHAAALFDPEGELLCLREDIGRHNAVDKVIGWALLGDRLPLSHRILAVSGRAGFEIVQKAMMAAIPVLVSVGAASNLAVRLALRGGLELHSFVSTGRSNRHLPSESP